MNWNDKNSDDVTKEKIWKEYCLAESRELRVYDRYTASKLPLACSPISRRSPDFLDRTPPLMRTICGSALPEVRQRSLTQTLTSEILKSPSPFSSPSNESRFASSPQLSDGSTSPTLPRPSRRLTSSSEIGLYLRPLVPENRFHYHYGRRKLQISSSVQQ